MDPASPPDAAAAAGDAANDRDNDRDSDLIECPNCGEWQSRRTICRQCSANIPMALSAKLEADKEARAARMAEWRERRGLVEGDGDAAPLLGLGLRGRMGRWTGATASLLATAVLVLAALWLLQRPSGTRLAVFAVVSLLVLLYALRLTALRLHDIGRSGWWTLLLLVPYVGVLFSLALCVWPGSRGANAWGEPPRPGRPWPAAAAALALLLVLAIGLRPLVQLMSGDLDLEAAAAAGAAGARPKLPRDTRPVLELPNAEARAAFDNEYTPAPEHKAFAVSPAGAWGWKSGEASPEAAIVGAIMNCEVHRAADAPHCEPVNVNGVKGRTEAR